MSRFKLLWVGRAGFGFVWRGTEHQVYRNLDGSMNAWLTHYTSPWEPEPFECEWRLLGPREPRRPGVSIQNLSVDRQGRMHKLDPSYLRRWWQAKRGWTHYPGNHFFD